MSYDFGSKELGEVVKGLDKECEHNSDVRLWRDFSNGTQQCRKCHIIKREDLIRRKRPIGYMDPMAKNGFLTQN